MENLSGIQLVRPADVEEVLPPAHWNMSARTLASREGRLRVQLCEMAADGGADAHAHPDEEQILFVVQGSLLVSDADGRETVTRSGDAVVIAAGAAHGTVATGNGEVRYLVLTFPAADR